jgi:hypothetical protein
MPTYNIECTSCGCNNLLNCSISDFQFSNKNNFQNLSCKSCGKNNFIRKYKEISSKISRSSHEIVEKAREEARSIVERVKNGDQHAIRDVYGEGE